MKTYITDELSQNTTGQLEVQGTEAKHKQQYEDDEGDLGSLGGSLLLFNRGGGHLVLTEKFSHYTINKYKSITQLSQCADHTLSVTPHTWGGHNNSPSKA